RYPMRPRAQQQLYLDERKTRPGWQDHQEWTLSAAAADLRGSRQGLDLLGGHVRVGGVDIERVDKMPPRPFDESVCIVGDRRGRWISDMLEYRIEHRTREPGQFGHELGEFTV